MFLLTSLGLGDWRISNTVSTAELALFEAGFLTLNKPYCMQNTFCGAKWELAGLPAVVCSHFLVTFCHLLAVMQITMDLLPIRPVRWVLFLYLLSLKCNFPQRLC